VAQHLKVNYCSAKIKVEGNAASKSDRKAIKAARRISAPPNSSFFGIRPIFFYNLAGTPKEKGFRHWLKPKSENHLFYTVK
jgi:hypothetical protein